MKHSSQYNGNAWYPLLHVLEKEHYKEYMPILLVYYSSFPMWEILYKHLQLFYLILKDESVYAICNHSSPSWKNIPLKK